MYKTNSEGEKIHGYKRWEYSLDRMNQKFFISGPSQRVSWLRLYAQNTLWLENLPKELQNHGFTTLLASKMVCGMIRAFVAVNENSRTIQAG